MCKMIYRTVSTCSPSCLTRNNQRATVPFKARTHISWGIDDVTVCILSLRSLMSRIFLLYMCSFTIPRNQKSQGIKSGECGGHGNGPLRPIRRTRKCVVEISTSSVNLSPMVYVYLQEKNNPLVLKIILTNPV